MDKGFVRDLTFKNARSSFSHFTNHGFIEQDDLAEHHPVGPVQHHA
jgi:hypothetical protein